MFPLKIFLASSTELQNEREQLQRFIDNRNKSWMKKGVTIELVIWEDFIGSISKALLLDAYNQAIRDYDLFVMLFNTKADMYTVEEFATAFGSFKKTNKPIIYIFFKDDPATTGTANQEDLMGLWAFQEKLKDLRHFQTTYKSTEDLLLQFGQQLDKLVDEGFIKLNTIDEAVSRTGRKIPHHLTPPPFIPEIFQGREDELQVTHQKLCDDTSLLLLVNGEGGIGKTTLAAKYWQRYELDYKHAAWVFAQKNLLDALLTIASPLQVEFPESMPPPERLQKMLATMASLDKPCLLIIDNANDVQELETHYLSLRACPNFHVLLTTRITSFEQAEMYKINPLKEEDALVLFKKHYPKHENDEDDLLKSIFSAVGGNTLVMELLAKNLAAINTGEIFYTLADFLQDLQKRVLLQIFPTGEVTIAEKGHNPAIKRVQPTAIIGALYNEMVMVAPLTENEQRMLCNLAVLPAENMSYTLLKTLLASPDAREFSGTLAGLAKKGWLETSRQENDYLYKISAVVQEVTLHKNKAILLAYCATLIDTLIEKLDFQLGNGHFLNASYEEAALYSRYAEAVMVCFQEIDYKLSLLCESIGNYHKNAGNLSKALKFFNEYNRLTLELLKAYPNNMDFKKNLAVSYNRLGTVHTALGNLDQALGWYAGDLRLTRELYEAYPNNVNFKNGLAISCQYLGNTYTEMGDLDLALRQYEEYHRLEKELHEANPGNVDLKNGLAIACERLGTIHTALGNLDQALGLYEEYHRLAKELHEANPYNVDFKNGLAVTCQFLGYTHSALDNQDQALGYYETYYHLKKELNEAYPDNVQFKNGLAIACGKLASTLTSLDKLDQALKLNEEYHRLEKELYEAFPDNVEFKNGLAISCQYLGNTHTGMSNLGQALGLYEEFNRLEKELYEAYPDNVEFKNNLAISLICLGLTFEKVENMAKAREHYEHSKALLEQLVQRSPLEVKFKNNLDWVTARLNES